MITGPIRHAMISLGLPGNDERVSMGQHTKIICYKKIVIGHQSLISWDCTLMDSDAHPFYDLEQQRLISNSESIVIGCRTFIGQRSTILKGAFLPNYSSLASNSLLNKDGGSICFVWRNSSSFGEKEHCPNNK